MNNVIGNSTIRKVFLIAFLLPLMLSSFPVQAAQKTENVGEVSQPNPAIVGAQKINPTTVEVLLSGNRMITFDFYGDNIFRMFQDNTGRYHPGPGSSTGSTNSGKPAQKTIIRTKFA